MLDATDNFVQNEIKRLQELGWILPQPDRNGVRKIQNIDETKISFPAAQYEDESNLNESEGIWAEVRANVFAKILKENSIDLIWEVGAGHGNVAIPLKKIGIATIAIEPLYGGAKILASKGFCVLGSTLELAALPDSCIKAIGLFDVLEHLENPKMLLREVMRVLTSEGILITSVPAYQLLFSNFDLDVGHFRRYTRKSLEKDLIDSGFKNNQMSNLFFFLLLPAFILRTIPYMLHFRSLRPSMRSVTQPKSLNFFDFILRPILRLESKLKIPFGLSIVSVSIK